MKLIGTIIYILFLICSASLPASCIPANTAAHDFFTEINTPEDYDGLIDIMSAHDIVLLGESTHGTQQFYEIRSKITKRLIKEHGFNFVVVEGDWHSLYELNLYVRGLSNRGSAREILGSFERWPVWMWANKEINDLAEWLKEYNSDLSPEDRVGFYGMDVYGAEKSLLAVQELSGLRYERMSLFARDLSSYPGYLYQGNKPCDDEVSAIYHKIKNDGGLRDKFGEKEFFYLKQNAFVVKNAEKHYRAMVFFDLDSWNERVLHMSRTLDKLLQKKGNKAVLWAHNTHVGDARFTAMVHSNRINIGQLLRQAGRNVFILGFGTYAGQVLAGRAWGREQEVMTIPEANEMSYEHLFSELGMNRALMIFDDPGIPEKIRSVNNNRAIGVVYDPENEYPGNYVPTLIDKRYDAFIFIKNTSALKLLF